MSEEQKQECEPVLKKADIDLLTAQWVEHMRNSNKIVGEWRKRYLELWSHQK